MMTDAEIDSACLSYRHDFGLLSKPEKDRVRFECREWVNAISKARPSPKVRKLVWSRVSGSLGLHAEGYSIHADIDRCVFLYLGVYRIRNFGRLSKESLRSAKAAAQADYEARILGALE